MKELDARRTLQDNSFESFVAHESTAEVLSERLGMSIIPTRKNLLLGDGDYAIIAQLPRPLEGQVYTKEEVASIY